MISYSSLHNILAGNYFSYKLSRQICFFLLLNVGNQETLKQMEKFKLKKYIGTEEYFMIAGFATHNAKSYKHSNLQLSFSNESYLLQMKKTRKLSH